MFFCNWSRKLYEYCSRFENCEKINSKPTELIKKARQIFLKSDEKEEIFECAKSIYFECSNANLNLVSNQIWYCHCDDFQGCENYIWSQGYCFICQVNSGHND